MTRHLTTGLLVAHEQSVVYDPEDSDSTWVRLADNFTQGHRCNEVARG
jgi:hypothetical protein